MLLVSAAQHLRSRGFGLPAPREPNYAFDPKMLAAAAIALSLATTGAWRSRARWQAGVSAIPVSATFFFALGAARVAAIDPDTAGVWLHALLGVYLAIPVLAFMVALGPWRPVSARGPVRAAAVVAMLMGLGCAGSLVYARYCPRPPNVLAQAGAAVERYCVARGRLPPATGMVVPAGMSTRVDPGFTAIGFEETSAETSWVMQHTFEEHRFRWVRSRQPIGVLVEAQGARPGRMTCNLTSEGCPCSRQDGNSGGYGIPIRISF